MEGEFDTQTNGKRQYRWVYNSPTGAEFLGPGWHKTKKAALQAGRDWLEARGTHEQAQGG